MTKYERIEDRHGTHASQGTRRRSWWRMVAKSPLWARLWGVYLALCFVSMSTIMILSGTGFATSNYLSTFDDAILEKAMQDEVSAYRAARSGLVEAEANASLDTLAQRIMDRALVLRNGAIADKKFSLNDSSRPIAYVEIVDETGQSKAVRSTPNFEQDAEGRKVVAASVPLGLEDTGLVAAGKLVAPFDLWLNLTNAATWTLSMSPITLLTSALIGLAAGLVSADYVTRRLSRIDAITAEWRRGRFNRRIQIHTGDELETHAHRLNAMATELESFLSVKHALAVTEERNRIARDLHDTVKQKLFALGLQLAAAEVKAAGSVAESNVKEAHLINREAQEDLVDIISQLRPAGEEGNGLPDQIEELAKSFMRRFDVQVDTTLDDRVIVRPRDEISILRIIQESVGNSVRHSGASKISIRLLSEGEACRLNVSDNGVGFDTKLESNGLGLRSIRERAAELPRGTSTISSSADHGTSINVSWRCASSDDA